jgi:hypothetical protein
MKKFSINLFTLAFFPYIISAALSASFDPLYNLGFQLLLRLLYIGT